MSTILPLSHLGDMPIETFIAEYWHKKPLLIRQAFPDFQPPVSADELAGLACEAEVESRLLIENPENGDWQLRHGPFEEALFSQLPEKHWTLLVQAVDHWLPEAADLVELFRFIPSWRLDDLMISYAADGGGVGPHYDNYDVFLLQAEGRRRWEIGGLHDEESEFLADKPVRILKEWQPEQSWLLEPGDMLYLPPRVGHNGVAVGDGCVTWSVGYRAPHTGDMLINFAAWCARQLKDEDRYADPDLSLRRSSGEICQSDMERVQSLFHRFFDDHEQLASWFGQFVTEPKYPEQIVDPQAADPQETDHLLRQLQRAGAGLRRCEGVRFAYNQGHQRLRLYVHGQLFECDRRLQPLVQLLCDNNQYTADQLSDWYQDGDAVVLIRQLLEAEYLYPE